MRYFRHAPECGSYVFRVREPRGAVVAAEEGWDVGEEEEVFFIRRGLGLVMWYLVVMRVCGGGQFGGLEDETLGSEGRGGEEGGRRGKKEDTYCGRPRLD